MSAGILTVCLTVGMLAGTFTSGTAEQVSGAITGFTSNDFLKCYGTSIRNNYGNGNTVHLRGTNAGGLFVQESWMCSTNVRDQKTLMSNLKDRFGKTKCTVFLITMKIITGQSQTLIIAKIWE